MRPAPNSKRSSCVNPFNENQQTTYGALHIRPPRKVQQPSSSLQRVQARRDLDDFRLETQMFRIVPPSSVPPQKLRVLVVHKTD